MHCTLHTALMIESCQGIGTIGVTYENDANY